MNGESRDGSFSWHITDDKIVDKITRIEPGERLDSEIFEICGAKWFLRLFPNGTKKKYQGRVSLFLQLCSLPVNTTKLKIKLILSCDETNTQYSDIKNFSEEREFGGWTGGILNTVDLKKHKKLTFRVHINVIAKDMYGIDMNQQHQQHSLGSHPPPPHAQHPVGAVTTNLPSPLVHYPSANDIPANSRTSRDRSPMTTAYRSVHSSQMGHAQTGSSNHIMHSVPPEDGNAYFNKMVDEEHLKWSKLESIEIRLNSLSLNIMHLNSALKQIADSVQMINTKIDNHTDSLLLQQQHHQTLQQSLFTMNAVQSDLHQIKAKLAADDDDQVDVVEEEQEEQAVVAERDGDDDQVKQWLSETVKLSQYIDMFVTNGLDDMHIIADVTNEDLQMIGIDKLGHRKKILLAINTFKEGVNEQRVAAAAKPHKMEVEQVKPAENVSESETDVEEEEEEEEDDDHHVVMEMSDEHQEVMSNPFSMSHNKEQPSQSAADFDELINVSITPNVISNDYNKAKKQQIIT